MKLRLTLAVATALTALATAITPVSAAEVTLKVAHFLPSVAPAQRAVLEPWCATLTEESKGRIECQFYPAMQLGGTPGQLVDQVRNGVADVAWTAPGYSTGRFPAIEALELPFVITDATSGAKAAWDYYEAYATKEFEAYKVLAIHTDGGTAIHTKGKEVKSPADFRGLKLRTSNRLGAQTLIALGGAPVAMPPAQVTEAIAKGVVDGAMGAWEVVVPTKLDEVTDFHAEPPKGQAFPSATVLVVLMNKQRFDSLPADLKAIVEKNSGPALVARFGQVWDEVAAKTRAKVAEAGHPAHQLSQEAMDAMRKGTSPVVDGWVKTVTAKGLDGEALVTAARALAARH